MAGTSVEGPRSEAAAVPEVITLNGDVHHRDGVGAGPSNVDV